LNRALLQEGDAIRIPEIALVETMNMNGDGTDTVENAHQNLGAQWDNNWRTGAENACCEEYIAFIPPIIALSPLPVDRNNSLMKSI
jgi:hypothetical protein